MERECWRAVITIDGDWSVRNLGSLVQRIRDDNCLSCHYVPGSAELIVMLNEAHTLRYAPSGTHEFARGWEAHKSAAWLREQIGEDVTWEAVKVYDGRRVVPVREGSTHRGFVL